MPVDFMPADAHGRILKAITEQPACRYGTQGVLDIRMTGLGAIEQAVVIACPGLNIASHRFAIQADILRFGAEENVDQFVFPVRQRQFILMAQNTLPTMRAFEGIAHRSMRSV